MRPDDLTRHYSEVVCGITDNILARTTPKQILDLSDLFLETFRPILIESIDADINKTANEHNTKLRFSWIQKELFLSKWLAHWQNWHKKHPCNSKYR